MSFQDIRSKLDNYLIWVIAPAIPHEDENLNYYYDFDQSINEYKNCFEDLGLNWQWSYITLENYEAELQLIHENSAPKSPFIINLCDGDEINGAPGISIIRKLKQLRWPFTGSDEFFYENTTSKIPMKKLFDELQIPTPKWELLDESGNNVKGIFERLGFPIILKPAVSGGSMGLGIRNVVHDELQCLKILNELKQGYRGWNLLIDGIIAEEFIPGREFTSLLTGSFDKPEEIVFYEVAERVFSNKIPETEQILSFDRLWETYENESTLPDNEFLFNYHPCSIELNQLLNNLSKTAYLALQGTGYTRLDIRQHSKNGQFYVLEANAQCGLSEDENYTSIGAILRLSNLKFSDLIYHIIKDSIRRHNL